MGGSAEPGCELLLLGGFELRSDGIAVDLGLSSQRVLAFVALHHRRLGRAFVAGTLWPDTTDTKAAANLRTALWRLRRPVAAVVRATSGHLGLDDGVRVDVRELATLAEALQAEQPGLVATAVDPHSLAGELLPDWWDSWLVIERERLRQVSLHALERLCQRLVADGEHGRAVLAGVAAVEVEPLRESANRVLIEAHLAEGNRSEARRQFHRYRALLTETLGLEPSEGLAAMVGIEPSLTRE